MKLNGLKGLKAHNEAIEKAQAEREAQREAASLNYMKLKDGMWLKGFFVEELDDEASGYDKEIGTAHFVLEHSGPGPQGYKRRAECTVIPDGTPYPHEGCIPDLRRWESNQRNQNGEPNEDWKNWKRATPRVYVNFFVTEAGGEFTDPKSKKKVENPHKKGDVILIGQAADSKQSIMPTLLGYAEEGSVTDRPFRITCAGTGTDTTYTLRGYDKEEAPFKASEVERNDLSDAYKSIPFEEQANYYDNTPGWVAGRSAPAPSDEQDSGSDSGEDTKSSGFKSW